MASEWRRENGEKRNNKEIQVTKTLRRQYEGKIAENIKGQMYSFNSQNTRFANN